MCSDVLHLTRRSYSGKTFSKVKTVEGEDSEIGLLFIHSEKSSRQVCSGLYGVMINNFFLKSLIMAMLQRW